MACWATPGGGQDESRFRIDLTPADHRTPGRQLWTGTEAQLEYGSRSLDDMPEWVRQILTGQYDRVGTAVREAAAARAV